MAIWKQCPLVLAIEPMTCLTTLYAKNKVITSQGGLYSSFSGFDKWNAESPSGVTRFVIDIALLTNLPECITSALLERQNKVLIHSLHKRKFSFLCLCIFQMACKQNEKIHLTTNAH